MNPLTELCAQVSRAGYFHEEEIQSRLHNDDVLNLGKFLLGEKLSWAADEEDSVALGFGGGIDSYCALLVALEKYEHVHLVYVDYGHPYALAERLVFNAVGQAICVARTEQKLLSQLISRDFEVIDRGIAAKRLTVRAKLTLHPQRIRLVPECNGPMEWGWKDYIVPARNLVLASVCAEYSNRVWIVANKRSDETIGARDKTSKFYKQSSAIFSAHYRRPVRVESPFMHMSKLEVVEETTAKFDNLETLKLTFSCYTPVYDNQPCGTCYACYKRFKLFQALNAEYAFHKHPQDGPHFKDYEEAEKRKRG